MRRLDAKKSYKISTMVGLLLRDIFSRLVLQISVL